MGYTKQQLIEGAFEEIGMAAYVFDLTPEQLQSGLRHLDNMMSTWSSLGIRVGYPLSDNPEDSNLTTRTNVPNVANEAIIKNLAIRLAPGYGKTVAPETRAIAKQGYDALLIDAAKPRQREFPATLPRGAGNRTWDSPFTDEPEDTIVGGPSGTPPWEGA